MASLEAERDRALQEHRTASSKLGLAEGRISSLEQRLSLLEEQNRELKLQLADRDNALRDMDSRSRVDEVGSGGFVFFNIPLPRSLTLPQQHPRHRRFTG